MCEREREGGGDKEKEEGRKTGGRERELLVQFKSSDHLCHEGSSAEQSQGVSFLALHSVGSNYSRKGGV